MVPNEVHAQYNFEGMIGESAAIANVREAVQTVAPTDAPVVITGETGTGKELVARAVHALSARRDQPIIKVNCASIPRELFESEFFGHVRGAFTGAIKDRVGRFQLADGGTLFLDEIGEIPIEMQGKLLRVLQEGEYERVGDARTRTTDVRVVAATNRDLRREVEEGRFRQDLFYRLNVFPISVPALRDRERDVELLAKRDCTKLHNLKDRRLVDISANHSYSAWLIWYLFYMACICKRRFFGAALPVTFLLTIYSCFMVAIFSCFIDPMGSIGI